MKQRLGITVQKSKVVLLPVLNSPHHYFADRNTSLYGAGGAVNRKDIVGKRCICLCYAGTRGLQVGLHRTLQTFDVGEFMRHVINLPYLPF